MPFPTRFVLMAAMISSRTAMEKKDYLNNRETVNHTLIFSATSPLAVVAGL